MKKLLAISILCSSSALIGFSVAGVMLSVNESASVQRAYDLMKACNQHTEFDKDSQIQNRVMMLQALNSDDQEVKDLFRSVISKALLDDAVKLKNDIDSVPNETELFLKKSLLEEIEHELSIKAS